MGVVDWDLKKEEGNLHEDGKEIVKTMFGGSFLTMGHREDFDQYVPARLLLVYHTLVHIKL